MAKLEVRKEFWESLTIEAREHYQSRYEIIFKEELTVNGK
jgi:hypothetical protein